MKQDTLEGKAKTKNGVKRLCFSIICINAKLTGAPTGFTMEVREVRLAAGAGFVVVSCGSIMTMPGLPKKPAAVGIDVDADGKITGLF